jgi:hypothetical protein
MTSAASAYWGNQRRPVVPRYGAEAGEQLRHAIWKAASRSTSDKLLLASIRGRYPKGAAEFSDAALLAVTRELAGDRRCSWCHYRAEAASAGESLARPSPALNALLGSRCGRCRVEFGSQVVAERRKGEALAASLAPASDPPPKPAVRKPAPAWYGSRRTGQAW